jgi:lantibiotic modifying enzyme
MNRLDEIVAKVFSSQIDAGLARVHASAAQFPSLAHLSSLQLDATRILRRRVREMATGGLLQYGFDRKRHEREPLLNALERAVSLDSGTAFRDEYSELNRCIDVVCKNLADRLVEVVTRFGTDRDQIAGVLSATNGNLESIVDVMSDHHEKQACVFLLRIGGRLVVYKSKPLDADLIFHSVLNEVARQIPALPFRGIPVLNKTRYGWMGFVTHRPCANLHEVSQFYVRIGYMLSVLVALRSTDHHWENLIADSDNPFFLDLECSFMPSVILDKRSPCRMSMKSVGVVSHVDRIGEFQFDRGALAWRTGASTLGLAWRGWGKIGTPELDYEERLISQSPNSPHAASSLLGSRQFLKFLLAGYKEGRRILRRLSTDLRPSLASMHDKPMRLVLRGTRFYQELLAHSLRPWLCKDTKHRRSALRHFLEEDDPRLEPLVIQEVESLMDGEIPHFQHCPGDRIVWANGSRFEGIIRTPGLDLVLRDLPRQTAGPEPC